MFRQKCDSHAVNRSIFHRFFVFDLQMHHWRHSNFAEKIVQSPAKATAPWIQNQRQVFQLRVCEGLPFEEVARRIGVSEGNARVLLLRARNKLKSELGCNHEQDQ